MMYLTNIFSLRKEKNKRLHTPNKHQLKYLMEEISEPVIFKCVYSTNPQPMTLQIPQNINTVVDLNIVLERRDRDLSFNNHHEINFKDFFIIKKIYQEKEVTKLVQLLNTPIRDDDYLKLLIIEQLWMKVQITVRT